MAVIILPNTFTNFIISVGLWELEEAKIVNMINSLFLIIFLPCLHRNMYRFSFDVLIIAKNVLKMCSTNFSSENNVDVLIIRWAKLYKTNSIN